DDGGSQWIWSSRGFGGLDLQNVEAGAGAVLAGTWGNGVFRRTSRGWIRSNTGLLGGAIDGPFGFMDEIDAGPGSAVVYTKELNDGFYRSGDRGRTWTLIQRGPDAPSYVAIVPGTPNHVFTTDDYLGVQESTDGGRHWTARNAGLPTRDGYVFAGRVTLDLTDPERLYLGMEHDVYASSNGGTSWVASGPGIPHRLWYPRPVVDPMAPRTLFVLTDHVLYRSTDRGRTWSPLSGAPDHVTHLAFDASGVVYAVNGSRRGVFASTDGGVTWQTVHGGLPGPALDVTVSSGPPEETLFVATPTGVSELPTRLR
ncbi:MAG TPA: hypothetical protein VNN79_17515, partial [Actinomycetota bacterium]|nr:hypothetical protein [Actinomycetota bacterium]